jgi:hypothetical protein
MPSIFICTAELADNCMNLTVWGIKGQGSGHWVCPICRALQRKPLVRMIFLGHSKEKDDEDNDRSV